MSVFDLQLNGYKGIDFNADDLTLGNLKAACDAFQNDGGGRMLATIITDRVDRMASRIRRLVELHSADRRIADVLAAHQGVER